MIALSCGRVTEATGPTVGAGGVAAASAGSAMSLLGPVKPSNFRIGRGPVTIPTGRSPPRRTARPRASAPTATPHILDPAIDQKITDGLVHVLIVVDCQRHKRLDERFDFHGLLVDATIRSRAPRGVVKPANTRRGNQWVSRRLPAILRSRRAWIATSHRKQGGGALERRTPAFAGGIGPYRGLLARTASAALPIRAKAATLHCGSGRKRTSPVARRTTERRRFKALAIATGRAFLRRAAAHCSSTRAR
jgi:hypothetical protein